MGVVRGDSRDQGALFPVSLDELVPEDHVGRVIDAFIGSPESRRSALEARPPPGR